MCSFALRLKAIAIRLEVIAIIRLKAIASRLEAVAIRNRLFVFFQGFVPFAMAHPSKVSDCLSVSAGGICRIGCAGNYTGESKPWKDVFFFQTNSDATHPCT